MVWFLRLDLNMQVAIKFAYQSGFLEEEAKALRLIEGLNISRVANIVEFHQEAGMDILITEFVNGEDLLVFLTDTHERKQRLESDLVIRIASQLLYVLSQIQVIDMCHRDIKPQVRLLDLHPGI